LLTLFAGCGVFIAGMKMMSDGLEKSAGPGMKKLFNKISNNRVIGVGIGAVVTGIIQSSAATTIMVIGFVNAGVMTLMQAGAIIMGANIGTTVTGLLVSLSSFDVGLYASLLAFIGIMMTFIKKDKVQKIGSILCGLGLVFVGLDIMSGASKGAELKALCQTIFTSIDFPLLLIIVGVLVTALIQSSSAVTGLLIVLAGSGAIGVGNALFIVLGSNIGTCVTALIASAGSNTNARRAAFFHLLFNMLGTVFFTIIIWIFKDFVVYLLSFIGDVEWQIALFHLVFNVTTTLILLPFLKQLVKITEKVIREKKDDEEKKYQLRYIDDRLLQTPPIAVAQVQKEIMFMAEVAKQNIELSMRGMLTGADASDEVIMDNEARLNHTYHAVAKFLISLSAKSVSVEDEKLIGAYHHVISDIERIGDHAENFIEQRAQMQTDQISFSEKALAELVQMYDKVMNMFELAIHAYARRDYSALDKIAQIEEEVNEMKKTLSTRHIERLNKGDCAVERGTFFYAVISGLERVGDHLINIAFSIKNPTGSQSQRDDINEPVKA
ncbi:MAG: Na/Pi cotransporter family protein, partial [Clostridia bacterium]|nr:Na/Pi cotransporter family protein [Clostridia bacterium]